MARRSQGNRSSGAPRWTYILGAVVAAGGLVWAVASHYLPGPGTSDSVATTTNTIVTVTGSESIGVGTMNGGVINKGDGATVVENKDKASSTTQ